MRQILFVLLFLVSALKASIGEVTALRGEADIFRKNEHIQAKVGTKLEEGDTIQTSKKSKIQIMFNDKTIISLGQKSEFKIDEYLFDKNKPVAKFSIGKGFFKSVTGKIGKIAPNKFKIKTANATIGIRGTTIIAEVTEKLDIISCTQGQIVVSSAGKRIFVNAGERTIVRQMKAPQKAKKINRVILKQLDKKSNPKIVDIPIEETRADKTQEQSKENNKDEVKEMVKEIEKEDEKFEPSEENIGTNSLEEIQKIVGEQKPTYEGKVTQGTTSFGDIDKDSSFVKFGFDLGSGVMNGNMKFNDAQKSYDIDVGGKIKGDGSFNFNSNNGYDGGGAGDLSGNKLQNANGNFGFKEIDINTKQTNNIDGKFETIKD